MNTHSNLSVACRTFFVAVAILSSVSLATPKMAAEEPLAELPHGDRSFIEQATLAGMKVISISQMVIEKTSNPEVKNFAQALINDRTALNARLSEVALTKKVTLPAPLAAPRNCLTASSKDFDEDYLAKLVSDDEDTVKLFAAETGEGHDTEVIQFARTNLPILQENLEHARELQKLLK